MEVLEEVHIGKKWRGTVLDWWRKLSAVPTAFSDELSSATSDFVSISSDVPA
jgi:hypothetical protein